jgi:hypothetical protein
MSNDEPRTLDHTGILRRIDALDQLWLNFDRRRAEFLQMDEYTDPSTFEAAHEAVRAAWREYEAVRDTPYRMEGQP